MKNNLKDCLKKAKAQLKVSIERSQEKSSWMNFSALLTNIIMLMAYISISPALAEYQGTGILRFWACVVIIILTVIAVWELICQLGFQRLNSIITCLRKGKRKVTGAIRAASFKKKVGSVFAVLAILSFLLVFYHSYHRTEYYSSVAEVYGIPTGIGESLTSNERKNRAGYFKIEDYPFKHQIVLSYVDAYQQPDLLWEYSTAYNMAFFQPSAQIVYTYTTNKNRYLAFDQNSYVSARENGFREPVSVSYYSSTGKEILELEKNDYDKFEVVTYSTEDMPQLLNSTLFCMPDNQASEKKITAQVEVTYNSKGLPKTRKLNPDIYNQYGVNGERYDYDENNRLTSLYYLDINGDPVCNKLGIMMVAFQYEDNGQLRSICYYSDEEGVSRTEGYQGVFCEKFSYDENGNLAERRQYNRNGNGEYDKNAVCTYRYSYENGALTEETFWGIHNEAVRDNRFYSRKVSFTADEEEGKKKLTISFDSVKASVKTEEAAKEEENGLQWKQLLQAVMNTDDVEGKGQAETGRQQGTDIQKEKEEHSARQYAIIQYIMDREGDILLTEYQDENGNPVINEEGYAVKRYQYDEQKRKIGESYFDSEDMPCMNNNGYASVRYTYGSKQDERIKSKEFLDINEELILNTETGYALVKYEYFEQGKGEGIAEYYYDRDENPVRLREYGYAGKEQIYNESGLLIREAYLDEWGNLTYRTDLCVAEIQYEYADDGNVIRKWYKDAEGQPANRSDTGYAAVYQEFAGGLLIEKHYEGYWNQTWEAVPDKTTGIASVRYSYHNGRKKEEQYFDTEGKLTLRSDMGCAVQQFEYNDMGLLSARYYYGTDNSLILRKDTGYAAIKFLYNEHGQIIAENYYGTDEKPVISTEYNCAGMEYEYDENGNRTDTRYIGVDGKLMLKGNLSYAWLHKEYDSAGNAVRTEYYGTKGQPVLNEETGYASIESVYEDGKWMESRYYDEKGNLTLGKVTGYAVIKCKYNEKGQKISDYFYGIDEQPVISTEYNCAGMEYEYDESGNETDTRYIGVDGKLMLNCNLGYAWLHREYDSAGNAVRTEYYGTEGQPVLNEETGYASIESVYEDGNWVESRCYNEQGKLILGKVTGYAVIKCQYDEYGRRASNYFYGTDEQLIINSEYDCAGMEYEYDEGGNRTDIRYIGEDGQLMLVERLDYAWIHMEYDNMGNVIKNILYDEYEQPIEENKYENKKWIESRYYDEQGNLKMGKEMGCAVIKCQYNEKGQKIADYFYGENEQPVISTVYHCACIEYAYDERGNRNVVRYLDLDGKLMNRTDLGYAMRKERYDEENNVAETLYYDENGVQVEV